MKDMKKEENMQKARGEMDEGRCKVKAKYGDNNTCIKKTNSRITWQLPLIFFKAAMSIVT